MGRNPEFSERHIGIDLPRRGDLRVGDTRTFRVELLEEVVPS